ncbi:hypothetical protein A2334_01945 [Candidatus Roizmanbacteria bacterium RIFOXYB2_FULL_38_10]|uniref:Uncharacterized protein n=1 Tax=Candidatus Roizmanbacteria bacterium RIFOXYD1_FULL_38_12 TaxID=1802093 RepID=A0A1F7L222_9BACT|nr:MAG: hypothetical protein A3K47_05365 [Candidatus Roizmanbacteria bacterium RIFOXYA2_FULL_38_14]OGK64175.1 MAG: hypothetical protein A3K27_05365 [Candidatus Roizmanbacteria bacterium RIFOXYA1_FULL_37_12]OGK66021.1 MAG: hypothetical protein A3K38_05365 [Candidatus Roizmanbacteria bacterium RIFOXYB1_FULL_40_23]OGK67777.1 MAG: hypothetical protein A2334_01945 [Candidatus Roizmanbacteria bacterium RIFOXYB2_FULL_38_10]OGK70425.1 MAG: hypothetical protein A3K21_05370 [Candidatus Roizmanbacteria ba
MAEKVVSKESRVKGIALFDLWRRINIDGTLVQGREWPPKTIIKSWHNVGSVAEKRIASAVQNSIGIPLVGFWGAGGKTVPDLYDDVFLDQLQALDDTTRNIYSPGIETTLLLADTHADFNGYTQADNYLQEIGYRASQRGIATLMLSDLYTEWSLQRPDTHEQIDEYSEMYEAWNDPRYSRQHSQLVESAGKHHRNGASPEQAAYWYFIMRMQEKEPLSASFPNAILFANTSPDLGGWLLPKQTMPIMYMHAHAPWFQSAH